VAKNLGGYAVFKNTVLPAVRSFALLLVLLITPGLISANTLLVLGDSLSAAYGVPEETAWVNLLRQRLADNGHSDWNVVNASISGETADGGARRLPGLLKKHQPQLVILELGGNDGLRGFPPRVIEKSLALMLRNSQSAGAQTLLVGMQIPPNYGNRYTQAFAAIYGDLAQRYSSALVPFFLNDIYNVDSLMQSDGIHPTEPAQSILLDNVWPHLVPLL
jgi:acyl-CoA thioesterase-1